MFRFITVLTWEPDLSIDHHELDAQHQQQVALVSRIHRGLRDSGSGQALGDALADLAQHTEEHFRHEETLMYQCAYPRLDWHRRIHERLLTRLERIRNEMGRLKDTQRYELIEDLNLWLVDHIQTADTHFGRFLARQEQRSWSDRVRARYTLSPSARASK